MKIFNIDVFIVPNAAEDSNPSRWHDPASAKEFRDSCIEECERLGIDCRAVDDNTLWFQVWTTGLGKDNLTDHGCRRTELHKFLEDKPNGGRRSDLLMCRMPETFIGNAKEGDVIETIVTASDGETARVRWNFKQLPYRYSRFGRFEEVVKRLKKLAMENVA